MSLTCAADYGTLEAVIRRLTDFLGRPLEEWENFTASGSYPEAMGSPKERERALKVDIVRGRVPVPEGAEFTIEGAWIDSSAVAYWQPRITNGCTVGGR